MARQAHHPVGATGIGELYSPERINAIENPAFPDCHQAGGRQVITRWIGKGIGDFAEGIPSGAIAGKN